MPFVSVAQRNFMHSQHPEIATRWDKLTPSNKKLPYHVMHKSGYAKPQPQFGGSVGSSIGGQ